MQTKAILWDLDGVIVDSGPYHFEAYKRVFHVHGHDLTRERFFAELLGLRNPAIIRAVLGELPAEDMAKIADLKEETFRSLVQGHVVALPGACEMIDRAKTEGILQAIVSSTPRANIDLVVGSLGLRDAFATIVGEEDASRGKPDPEGFTVAAARLGVHPNACVVIEDAPEGITAGNAAGARTIAVTSTRPRDRLTHASLVVDTLDERVVWPFIAGIAS